MIICEGMKILCHGMASLKSYNKILRRIKESLVAYSQGKNSVGAFGRVRPLVDDEYAAVWKKYESVLTQEEIMWFQTGSNMVIKIVRTRYFHGVTAIRRSRNKYEMLQDGERVWVRDVKHLENLATNYYKSIFSDEDQAQHFVLI